MLKDEDFLNNVVMFVENIIERGKLDESEINVADPENFLLTFYSSLIIVSLLPRRVWTRYADAISKYVSTNVKLEIDRECIVYLCKEHGIRVVKISEINVSDRLKYLFDVAVPVWDYVKFIPRNDPNWKLINRYVVKGYVLLRYNDLARLLEEAVERSIINMLEKLVENPILSESIRKLVEDKISRLVKRYSQSLAQLPSVSAGSDCKHRYPPCIEAILSEIKSGGNPSHIARFTLAAFMLRALVEFHGRSIEEAVDEVVNLFRSVADFDERKTRYQVMHIAGLVGGRKFYMPPNCDELISVGICPVNGACGVKNPLAAYARLLRGRRSTARFQEHSRGMLKASQQ